MAQNWDIDPATGDYLQTGGAPIETDSLRVPAYYRLKIKAGKWMYAPNDAYGSTFNEIKKRQTGRDSSRVENAAAVALQPILDDGRAVSITIESLSANRNTVSLRAYIERQRGVVDQLEIPSLGV
jgi:phage gp46-like protein